MNEDIAARMATQNAEFSAAQELAKQMRRIELTPVVEDDYPVVRYEYERAVRNFLDACKANGRAFPSAELTSIDAEAIGWALRKLDAYGVWSASDENAMMMDRLKLMMLRSPERFNAAPQDLSAPERSGAAQPQRGSAVSAPSSVAPLGNGEFDWTEAPRARAIFDAYYEKEGRSAEDEERDLWIPFRQLERELADVTAANSEAMKGWAADLDRLEQEVQRLRSATAPAKMQQAIQDAIDALSVDGMAGYAAEAIGILRPFDSRQPTVAENAAMDSTAKEQP